MNNVSYELDSFGEAFMCVFVLLSLFVTLHTFHTHTRALCFNSAV